MGEYAVAAGLGEDLANGGQKTDGRRDYWTTDYGTPEEIEGAQRALGPIAAGDLGDGQEGTPVVGQAIEGAGRQRRVAGGEGIEIVASPTG